jgi:hypothetical protein
MNSSDELHIQINIRIRGSRAQENPSESDVHVRVHNTLPFSVASLPYR